MHFIRPWPEKLKGGSLIAALVAHYPIFNRSAPGFVQKTNERHGDRDRPNRSGQSAHGITPAQPNLRLIGACAAKNVNWERLIDFITNNFIIECRDSVNNRSAITTFATLGELGIPDRRRT
jgi:hypothetical protein